MSFVGEPFKHDIFITYSHGDVDGDGYSKLKQWSEGFASELEEELKSMPDLAADIRVFRDQHHRPDQGLDPMIPLTDQLKADVAGSAVLVVLMTPQYLKSAWCRDERDWWLANQRSASLSTEGRLAVARVWTTGTDSWPEDLVDSRGHKLIGRCFHDEALSESRPQPYEWPQPEPTSKDPFRGVLLDFVGDLRLHLNKLKAHVDQRRLQQEEAGRLAGEAGQIIYLHGREDAEPVWKTVSAELKAAGYQVFPSEPDEICADPVKSRKISDDRLRVLVGCDALMLLGTNDVRALDADLVVIGRNERHKAKAFSDKLLPCAVVDTAGLAGIKPRILDNARDLGIQWIGAEGRVWTPDVPSWLHGSWL